MIYIKNVGVIIRKFDENNKKFVGTRKDVIDVINKFDVNIILIPIIIDFDKILNTVNICDGVILTGGDNLVDNDYKLIDYLYKNNIPTLGICLGMQSMSMYFKGVEKRIYNHYSENLYVHEISINKNSKLFKILNKKYIVVNSRHNYSICNTLLNVSAKSEDGVVEAVEDTNKKFFIGVEWHPESTYDNNSYLLFKAFFEAL